MPDPRGVRQGEQSELVWGSAALSLGAAACGNLCLRIPRRCLELCLTVLAVCVIALVSAPNVAAQQPPVTSTGQQQAQQQAPDQKGPTVVVRFEGNRRIRSDTLRARILTRDGDPYSAESLNRDFQALWNTGYFEDIKLTVEDDPRDPTVKIVTFHVQERPTIRRINYKGNKSVSESDILDRFKDRKVGLSVESQFDPTKIKKAEVVLRELLAEHGRQYATVKATYEKVPASNAVILTFNVNEGAKVKVGKIIISGNHAFSSRRIIRTMKHSRPYAIPLKYYEIDVASKTFNKDMLQEDMEVGIRGLYQDNGYFEMSFGGSGEATLTPVEINKQGLVKGPVPFIGSKHGKATDIAISIQEGDQYRMGKLHIINADPEKGLTLKRDVLIRAFPLREGDIFDVDKIRKAIEQYTKVYGQFGFIDFTAEPEFDIDHKNKVINLTLSFEEQKQYYVHRINISGNVTTRDKVIRRELLLDEGDLYNNRLWEVSVLRLNQLDFFDPLKPETAASVSRNVKNGTVDLNLKVHEKGKQSISFTGGVSGISGTFVGLTYQTNNFLGLGERLTLSTQVGTIQQGFTFGFTEPYLFDRPISTGFTIFESRYNFDQARQTSILLGENVTINPAIAENYNQNSKGFTVFASYPIKHARFTRISLTYGYTDTNIEAFSDAAQALFEALQYQSLNGPSALTGIHQSKITPGVIYNTIGNPIDPHTGTELYFSAGIEGLGGNTRAFSTTVDFKHFIPTYHRRNTIGIHLLGAFITGYGGEEPPPFERFYAGGETSIRGFDVQTISPITFIPIASSTSISYTDPRQLDSAGNPRVLTVNVPTLGYTITFPGGDTEGIANFEYRIPIVGSYFSMDFFLDAGTVGAFRRNQLELNETGFEALQTAFPTSTLTRNLVFAPHSNFDLRSSTGIEFVINLPIVHAPFRIYWAYNFLRYQDLIVAPQGDYYLSDELKNALPPGVLETQILPQLAHIAANPAQFNYVDPLHTVRFTVSRTF
jgi:outer membrane protein insertion porin family